MRARVLPSVFYKSRKKPVKLSSDKRLLLKEQVLGGFSALISTCLRDLSVVVGEKIPQNTEDGFRKSQLRWLVMV